ncbi:Hypothetical predicted protein, partial [Olea europaea subsp. europaea]
MARRNLILLFVVLIIFTAFVSSIHGRKFLKVPSLDDRLFLNALPKGTVPGSTPSKKGHAVIIDEKLIALHLARIDRILRSVPSPG